MPKRIGFLLFLFALCLNCEKKERCSEGYAIVYEQDGTSTYVPLFEEGLYTDFQLGNTYFHKKHGVVMAINGRWTDRFNQVVTP